MKRIYLLATALAALVSCTSDDFMGDNSPTNSDDNGTEAIVFNSNAKGITRADFIGATAAEKLGGMFVVEGTKGSEQTNSPSTTVVFDNYLVGYDYNSAGNTESNTNNWEYVGLQSGIANRMTSATWTTLHTVTAPETAAQAQTVKYWDYSTSQYDFIAWSTGLREAVTDAAVAGSKVKVTRINTGTTLSSNGFQLTAANATDLLQCYYTDINTVLKAKYGEPVTLTFRNMAAKVRVALYETVPGYSVKDVKFYTSDANPTAPTDLGTGTSEDATLFTMGSDVLPQSGEITVFYPHIGTNHRGAVTGDATYPNPTKDYNKASVTVGEVSGGATSTTQGFGTLTAQYGAAESHEAAGKYLGRTLPDATYAGSSADNFYTAVIPNSTGKPLTLRVDYTLVSTDGSGEEIKVYGAKAVVPATYTVWQPNYAYTYVFKISDNSNGYTSTLSSDPKGLFPITFDAVVASFVDVNAEQTTVTTVATPSITTYQQGHTKANDEYSKSQKAGADATNVKALYVQVMDNSDATPTLKADLKDEGKSLLFSVATTGAPISEATVMDALKNRTNAYNAESPAGRNGITLTTKKSEINNGATSIVNGVDDQPITGIAAGKLAEIDIKNLTAGTYAYVYCTTVPSADEVVYNVVSATTAETDYAKYYEVTLTGSETPIASTDSEADRKAKAGKVYFVKNVKANGDFVSYTFKQTKVGDDVTGLVEATIDNKASSYTAGHFYFDVYNQNNGAYAVKVIKVVE
jgi:hypothetical protein